MNTVSLLFWILVFGLVAYALEYGLGITGAHTRLATLTIAVPLLLAYILLRLSPSRLGGRLKSGKVPDEPNTQEPDTRDLTFDSVAVIYFALYLIVVHRIRPRPDVSRMWEAVFSLSPIEIFWLGAPLVALWHFLKRNQDQ